MTIENNNLFVKWLITKYEPILIIKYCHLIVNYKPEFVIF